MCGWREHVAGNSLFQYSDQERGLLARSKVELFNEKFVLKFLFWRCQQSQQQWQENRNVVLSGEKGEHFARKDFLAGSRKIPCSSPDYHTQPGVLALIDALGSKLRMRVSNTTARGNMADAG